MSLVGPPEAGSGPGRETKRHRAGGARGHGRAPEGAGERAAAPKAGGGGRATLKSKVIRGSAWTMVGYGASQVLRLGSNLILARLLAPEAFGLVGMVNVTLQGLQLFSDIGIGASIIQNKRGEDERFLNTAWTIQIARGVTLWGIACLLAWPLSRFWNAPHLSAMLPVMGVTAAIAGFNATALFTLRRNLDLRRVMARDIVSQCVAIVVMIAWAAVSPSAWALVAGGVAQAIVMMTISHYITGGVRCRLLLDRDAMRDLFRFGRWVFLSTAIMFIASYSDRLLLGRALPLDQFGVYTLAFMAASLPMTVVARLSTSVLFPALSRRQADPERMIRAVLRSRAALMWAMAALCAGAAIVAPLFFTSLYKPAYHQAGPWTQWLMVFVWFSILNQSTGSALLASGRARQLMVMNLIHALGYIPAYFAIARWGVPGFILTAALARVAGHVYLVARLPALNWAVAAQSVRATLALGVYVVGVILGLRALEPLAPRWAMVTLTLAFAGAPCVLAAWQLKKLILERKQQAGPDVVGPAPEPGAEAIL